jgi:hypothetical protein
MVVSASMVGYYFYIRSSVASKKLLIDNQEATFKEYPYEDMKKVYDRMMALNILLKDYVTVRSSFRFLESIVENQVLFTQFALNKDDLTGVYTLQLLASTNDYKTLVQQLGAFNLAEYAKIVPSPRVDKITEQKESKEGTIKVQMTAPVNIAGILPEEVIGDSIVDASSSKTPVATTSNQTP